PKATSSPIPRRFMNSATAAAASLTAAIRLGNLSSIVSRVTSGVTIKAGATATPAALPGQGPGVRGSRLRTPKAMEGRGFNMRAYRVSRRLQKQNLLALNLLIGRLITRHK